jgi:hypothetical protein
MTYRLPLAELHRWANILDTELSLDTPQVHGTPSWGEASYHNEAIRKKAREFGLLINPRGQTEISEDPFTEALRRHVADRPALPPGQISDSTDASTGEVSSSFTC